ncbi:hypothetical protein ASC87_27255 [Rhizobacter sp. Root1221]|nr:hypothetical protein ASC87_27255 [Rhizobacter sp. Root1221]
MLIGRFIVAMSAMLSVGFIAVPTFLSRPMRGQLSSVGGFAECVLVGLLISIVCSWPWLVAYSRARDRGRQAGAIAFSSVSVACAALLMEPISKAPAEGIGYCVLIYVLGMWVSAPLILRIRAKS